MVLVHLRIDELYDRTRRPRVPWARKYRDETQK